MSEKKTELLIFKKKITQKKNQSRNFIFLANSHIVMAQLPSLEAMSQPKTWKMKLKEKLNC